MMVRYCLKFFSKHASCCEEIRAAAINPVRVCALVWDSGSGGLARAMLKAMYILGCLGKSHLC